MDLLVSDGDCCSKTRVNRLTLLAADTEVRDLDEDDDSASFEASSDFTDPVLLLPFLKGGGRGGASAVPFRDGAVMATVGKG